MTLQKTLSLLLALSAFPALAEDAVDVHEQAMMRAAVGMTACMVANAVEASLPVGQIWANRLAKTAFGTPLKAVVMKLTDEQYTALCTAVGADAETMLLTLAKGINGQYNADYAAAADALACQDKAAYEDYAGYGEWRETPAILTLLVYQNDLSLTLQNGTSTGAFKACS